MYIRGENISLRKLKNILKKKNYNIWQDIFCVYTCTAQTGATSKFASWYREEVYCNFPPKKLLLLPLPCVYALWDEKNFLCTSLFALDSRTRIGKCMNAHTSYECCNKFFRWSKNNFFVLLCIMKCFKWLLSFVVCPLMLDLKVLCSSRISWSTLELKITLSPEFLLISIPLVSFDCFHCLCWGING